MSTTIAASLIKSGNNDRKRFDPDDMLNLAMSIEEVGLQSPTIIRPIPADTDGHIYEVVAGDRRFRAMTQILGYTELIVGEHIRISELDDKQASDIMLVENTGRVNLNPVEEGIAYARRIKEYMQDDPNLSEKDAIKLVAKRAGVSTITVQFRVKLLALRDDLLELVKSGNLDTGYARIMVEMNLNHTYQAVAIDKLKSNPHPTPQWFRAECGALYDAQQQMSLFDVDQFGYTESAAQEPVQAQLPPTPLTDSAPILAGLQPIDLLCSQRDYWNQAAQQWQALGKSFKAQQCSAASAALDQAISAIRAINDQAYKASMPSMFAA